MSLFEDLKAAIEPEWKAYTEHEFVRKLGEGTLPLAVFQDYLVQDYLFLVQYARAYALAAYKSRNLADISDAAEVLRTTVHETELHRRLTARWGISAAKLDHAPEKQATVAYTRYVLDTGMSGDLLDLHIALTPCTIGYAEIGAALEPELLARDDHPYAEWITVYASEGFQNAARSTSKRLDALAGPDTPSSRFEELVAVFSAATQLETSFWQQALDSARGDDA